MITTATIKPVLRESRQLHREPNNIKLIRQGGRKTFAILVSIYKANRIVNFIYNGIETTYSSRPDLEGILSKTDAVDSSRNNGSSMFSDAVPVIAAFMSEPSSFSSKQEFMEKVNLEISTNKTARKPHYGWFPHR